jgi:hypothetical protein
MLPRCSVRDVFPCIGWNAICWFRNVSAHQTREKEPRSSLSVFK